MKRLLLYNKYVSGRAQCDCFDAACMVSPPIIRLCCYIVYFNHFNNHNNIGVPAVRGNPLVKDRDTLIEQSVTRINEAHRIIVKQVVYDEFMKQIRTVILSYIASTL